MSKIKSIGWSVVINGKPYGANIAVEEIHGEPIIGETDKETRQNIKIFFTQVFSVMEDQARVSVQKILTGRTEIDDLIEEARKKDTSLQ